MTLKVETDSGVACTREGQSEGLHELPRTGEAMGDHDGGSGGVRLSVDACRRIADAKRRNGEALASGLQLPDAKSDERSRKNPDELSDKWDFNPLLCLSHRLSKPTAVRSGRMTADVASAGRATGVQDT